MAESWVGKGSGARLRGGRVACFCRVFSMSLNAQRDAESRSHVPRGGKGRRLCSRCLAGLVDLRYKSRCAASSRRPTTFSWSSRSRPQRGGVRGADRGSASKPRGGGDHSLLWLLVHLRVGTSGSPVPVHVRSMSMRIVGPTCQTSMVCPTKKLEDSMGRTALPAQAVLNEQICCEQLRC